MYYNDPLYFASWDEIGLHYPFFQPWAKIKDMDDNNVAMDLNTSRLVGERKPKRSLSLSRHKETSLQADVCRTKICKNR